MRNHFLQEGLVIRRDFPEKVWILKYPNNPNPTSKTDMMEVPSRPTIHPSVYAKVRKTKGNLAMRLTNVLTYRWAALDILENGNRSIALEKSELYRQVTDLYPRSKGYLTETIFKTYIAPCTRYKCIFMERKCVGRSVITGNRLFKVASRQYRFLAVSDLMYGMEFQMSTWMPFMRAMIPGFVSEREFTSELMGRELEDIGDPEFDMETLDDDYFFGAENTLMEKAEEKLKTDRQRNMDMSEKAVQKRERSAELLRHSRMRRSNNLD